MPPPIRHDVLSLNARIVQAVREIAPGSEYERLLSEAAKSTDLHAEAARGLLGDLNDGYFASAHDLAHTEVFKDLLDMADYLLDKGWTVAAAVTAGGTGESHLRQLAVKKIPCFNPLDNHNKPKNGNTLNTALAAANVYGATLSKHITAWQGIRNGAAHDPQAPIDHVLVKNMISGLRKFISDNPA